MSAPEPHPTGYNRRTVLALGTLTGAVAVGIPFATSAAAVPAAIPDPHRWAGDTTQNGWNVVGSKGVSTFRVEGSGVAVTLLAGAVATVLLHVARRWHYDIAELNPTEVLGHTTVRKVAAPLESNYLSGTAMAIRPSAYPIGTADNMFGNELLVVRDVLAECEGVVRWGGDDPDMPKEGHFQIDVGPKDPALERVAAKVSAWNAASGRGAGTPVELIAPSRLAGARALERRQTA
jgi:hypothetical protein